MQDGGSAARRLLRSLREDVLRAIESGALASADHSLLVAVLPVLGRFVQSDALVALTYDQVRHNVLTIAILTCCHKSTVR